MDVVHSDPLRESSGAQGVLPDAYTEPAQAGPREEATRGDHVSMGQTTHLNMKPNVNPKQEGHCGHPGSGEVSPGIPVASAHVFPLPAAWGGA